MTPYFGTVSLAFVGPPTIKVQLLPYNRVRLMQVPIVQVGFPLPLRLNLLLFIMHMCSTEIQVAAYNNAHMSS